MIHVTVLYRGKLSCMSLIIPHWIPSNLWWALPLLAAVLGAALRRVLPRTAAARGAPVCLRGRGLFRGQLPGAAR